MGPFILYKLTYIFYLSLLLSCFIRQTQQEEIHQSQQQVDDFASSYLQWKFEENSHKHHSEIWTNNSSSSKIMERCKAFVSEFSKRASEFIKCTVDNARPFRFCEFCVTHYVRAITAFNDIVQVDDVQKYNCSNLILNSDRVQVINSVCSDIKGIWSNADCGGCFSSMNEDVNGTVTYTKTAKTLDFLQQYDNFRKCLPPEDERTHHNKTVCKNCQLLYDNMNKVFKSMMNTGVEEQHICMDIVDMMNYSRLMWGDQLKCTDKSEDYAPVIGLALFLLIIPVAFYVGMAVYGTKRERKLMTPKRLTTSYKGSAGYGSYDQTYPSDTDSGMRERSTSSETQPNGDV